MALVIETTKGNLVLSSIDLQIDNLRDRQGGWIAEESIDVVYSSFQIKLPDFVREIYESLMTPENKISDDPPMWPGRGVFYKSLEPYILKNGYKLYINPFFKNNDSFYSFTYALYDGDGNFVSRTNSSINRIISSDDTSNYNPIVYLFSQPRGVNYYAYITMVSKDKTYLSTGTGGYPAGYFYGSSTNELNSMDIAWPILFKDIPGADNPFYPGGESGVGGGSGSFDNTSEPIDIPNLPSISASSTGFISLFNPTLSQLNELASYLWSDLFEIDGWKKLFADPMDAILGLSILPVSIPSGGIREVKVGNIGTGISLTVAASQFVEVDCGSIDVNEYWGAYLDYEPYTQAQIFLPYIGTRPISVDEIMGKTVRVVYHVDILTGACCCFVKCGDSVLYTYNGQCSIPIPITGANYTSVVNGVISVAASVGSLVATGGASAPIAVPAIASSVVNQMKPQIEKSGSISGSAGVLNMQTPYLILIRPRQALPSKQNEFIGYPSLITVQLTELSGYTEVQSIHLENIPATQEEIAEIQSLLEGGVIF